MAFKFEKLDVWQLSVEHCDTIYAIADLLPRERAATSVSLNIAEGSTSQSDAEQARFLVLAIRSLIETVACRRLIERRGYGPETEVAAQAEQQSEVLFRKLQAMRRLLRAADRVRESETSYGLEDGR